LASFEEECIERYFLAPGSSGPIGSVYVADDDLLEIFGVADLTTARERLLKNLPHILILRQWLSGEIRPTRGKAPNYVRMLAFLCWMQTTEMPERRDRDFRELLGKQLGANFTGANMSGLNHMWEHLRDFLAREHGVVLVLPDIHPNFTRIGRTLQLAFPTWRDRSALRKLKKFIPEAILLDPLMVSNSIRTTRRILGDTMQSFEYNFDEFDEARKRGSREYEETQFWRAWYAVVAEEIAIEEIEVVESDFGGYELFRVPPVGERVSLASPEEALKLVPKPLAKLISKGLVFLDSLGFGRYRAQAVAETGTFLMRVSKFSQCDPTSIRSSAAINSSWVVATFRGKLGERTPPASSKREFGWHDGIRIGSAAYLGRSPLTPSITGPLPEAIQVEAEGKPVSLVRVGDEMVLAPGIYSGTVVARSLGASQEVLMVLRANEVSEIRRQAFDPARYLPEDEFHYGTAPTTGIEFDIWSGERFDPGHEIVAMGEGLYERTARGLPFSEAVDIVRKAIALTEDHPSEWDVLRSFFDAGWIEPTFLRHFPARRLLQTELGARSVGGDAVIICGPTPLAVVDRLSVAARTAGGILETWNGASPWVLPRYVVRVPDDQSRREFLRRAEIRELPPSGQAVADLADHGDPHGFQVVGKLKADRGFFNACFEDKMADGLYRLERPGSNSLFVHRSIVPGKRDQNYTSPSVALLSHHLRLGSVLFAYDGFVMTSCAARMMLPSSWARWASDRALCNPGPGKGSGAWKYEYPAEDRTIEEIASLLPIRLQRDTALGWRDRFVLSASNRDRKIYDSLYRGIRMAAAMHRKSK